MPDADWWGRLLLVAAGAHFGLELVVHLVVYPALARSSALPDTQAALSAHQDHMRRMSIAVAPVYGLLVVSAVGLVVSSTEVFSVAALALVLATLAVTAFAAVPAHEAILRAAPGDRPALHRRLSRADLARLVLALALLPVAWLA